MRLDMSMVFLEGIVQVTIDPGKLRNVTKEEWSLLHFGWGLLISLSDWAKQSFVQVGMYNLIAQVPVRLTLMPKVLRVRRVIAEHFIIYIY